MAKDTFYFSHDYNARTDSKIKKLIRVHGYEGYGIYWAIVEDLYNNANALPTDYDSIAFDLHTQSELIKSILNDFDLFDLTADYFGSNSVSRRLEERENKSNKAKESAKKRWDNANAMRTHSDSNAIKERKGKERKEKEIVINTNGIKPNTDYKLELNEIQIGAAVQYMAIAKQTKVTTDTIKGLWETFKVKEFTGAKHYNNEGDIFTHFMNTLKYEKIDEQKPNIIKTNDDKAKKLLGIE
jgi:O6-methylguanine-DNA--protein-cysteine methyltransferase